MVRSLVAELPRCCSLSWRTRRERIYPERRLRSAAIGAIVAILALAWGWVPAKAAGTPAPGFAATDFATGFASVGYGPIGLAFDNAGNLFVADQPDGCLYKFPPSGGIASAGTQVGCPLGGPTGLAFSSDGSHLYMARQQAGDVVEVSPSTGAVLRTIASVSGATGLAIDPLSGDLFVSQPNNTPNVLRISGSGPGSVSTFSTPGNVDGMTFGPDGTLYVALFGTSEVAEIAGTNTSTPGSSTVLTNNVIGGPDGIALLAPVVGQSVSSLAVNTNNNGITAVDFSSNPATLSPIVTAQNSSRGDFVVVGPDKCLYATQSSSIEKVTAADGSCPFLPTRPPPVTVCSTTPASTGLADVFAADLCKIAQDETVMTNSTSNILLALASLPKVTEVGTTGVWVIPAAGTLPSAQATSIQTNLAFINAAILDMTKNIQNMIAQNIAARILGGEIPCAVSAWKDLLDAFGSDLSSAINTIKSGTLIKDLLGGQIDSSAALDIVGYALLGQKQLRDKLGSFASALLKDAAGCFLTEGQLAAQFTIIAVMFEVDIVIIQTALNAVGLTPTDGLDIVASVVGTGASAGLATVSNPNLVNANTQLPLGLLGTGATLAGGSPSLFSSISATNLNPGNSVALAGTNYAPNQNVSIYLGSTPVRLATAPTDSAGGFSIAVQIPTQTTPGTHEIYAVGTGLDGSARALGASITVNAVPEPPLRPQCTGTVTGTINGALNILPGTMCDLKNAVVNGTVTVSAGAVFEADMSTINGNVVAAPQTVFALCGDQVNGSVTVQPSFFPALIGNVDTPFCGPTTIAGSVVVQV